MHALCIYTMCRYIQATVFTETSMSLQPLYLHCGCLHGDICVDTATSMYLRPLYLDHVDSHLQKCCHKSLILRIVEVLVMTL